MSFLSLRQGKTIKTTEPKFVPEEAVSITVDESVEMNVRLIDCVGYIVPGAKGYIENEAPRMVKTPWFDEEVRSIWRRRSVLIR